MVREPLHLQIHDVRCRTHRIARRQSFLHQVLSLLGQAHHPAAVSQQTHPATGRRHREILADRHRLLPSSPANTLTLYLQTWRPAHNRHRQPEASTAQQYLRSDQPRQAQRRQRNATRVGCPGWRRPMDSATARCTSLTAMARGRACSSSRDPSGARETIRQMGNRLAGIGHVALIPYIYHRAGQRAPFDVATLFTDEPLLGARKPTTTGRTLPRVAPEPATAPAESRTGNQPPQTRQPRERAHLHGVGSSPLSGEAASPSNGDGRWPKPGTSGCSQPDTVALSLIAAGQTDVSVLDTSRRACSQLRRKDANITWLVT